jgi:hypothetical protein
MYSHEFVGLVINTSDVYQTKGFVMNPSYLFLLNQMMAINPQFVRHGNIIVVFYSMVRHFQF